MLTNLRPMDATAPASGPIDDEWVEQHFDYLSAALAQDLHATLARARERCPVSHSDRYGGYWVVTGYDDVLRVAQDWQTFSSELGIGIPNAAAPGASAMKIYPVTIDPPLQRTFKRLINAYLTPAVVSEWEKPTRELVNRLIDRFVASGECDFMEAFARPFPGLAFFDLALHAPPEDLEQVSSWATTASQPQAPEQGESLTNLASWIAEFVAERRGKGPQGDVVDAVLGADIDGRPITEAEAIGTIQLLIFGGLDTTAGVLGMAMLRFCDHPEIPALLRARPERIPDAVEELLRLDGSFACIGRTARHDTELGGNTIKEHESVLVYWASANRDPSEFERPDTFDIDRARNRHLAFGAGPHRCAGSHLARMNLRIAFEEIVRRLHDIELQGGAQVEFHSTFNRLPLSVPITFSASRENG